MQVRDQRPERTGRNSSETVKNNRDKRPTADRGDNPPFDLHVSHRTADSEATTASVEAPTWQAVVNLGSDL